MTTQQEIPISDAELDALMSELEAETTNMIAQPAAAVIATAAAPDETADQNDAELAAMEAELGEIAAASVEAEAAPNSPAEPAPTDTDAELAALEAELQESAAPAVESPPQPKPAVEPKPSTRAPKPAPAPVAVEDDSSFEPDPSPKVKPAALQFFIDVSQFRDETRVSETNLDDCMMQQAGLRAYYSEQSARAEAQYLRLKARFDVLEAQLYDQHRKALIAAGEKATEKQVENNVKLDPKWLKNKNVVIESETIASINKGLVESLRDRKDMLIQLGADRREEGKGQLRMMERDAAHANVKDRAKTAALAAA